MAAKKKTIRPKIANLSGKPPGDIKKPDVKTGFPIIGIGASAGGLEAFESFF